MPMFTSEKAIRSVRKTAVIIPSVLRGLSAEDARNKTDGPNGWKVVEVLGHLNDWETIFYDRAQRILNEENPVLEGFDQEELVRKGGYARQDIADVQKKFLEKRQRLLDLLPTLTAEQWARTGMYPDIGQVTLAELITNIAIHDVNHIEQIVHTLA